MKNSSENGNALHVSDGRNIFDAETNKAEIIVLDNSLNRKQYEN